MRPEDIIADKRRPFTGAEYMQSLRDGREVYIDGERVADVTTHPAFRNSVRSIARLYDALHDPAQQAVLTCPTDTGSGGYTHRYFRVPRSRDDLVAAQGAIAAWSRMTYGWMGRTPDYKAAYTNTLGGNPDYYGPYAANARVWYKRAQETVPFMNHAIVNPPVDRHLPAEKAKDVFVSVDKETDGGIIVSGAKVVATSAAMTHYNYMGQSSKTATEDLDMSLMFIVPIDAPGLKLFCRTSYERAAQRNGSPFDYPLSSRFDENDAIFVLDKVFVPWEDVFIYRDPARVLSFYPRSGFMQGFQFQGCTRFAVKLDFICGLLGKALRCTGGDEARGNQVLLGEAIAWRNLFWSLSNAMAHNPDPWNGDAVLPQAHAGNAYRVFAPDAYPRIKDIVERAVTSALIYLPSSAKDFANPSIEPYLRQYVRGSHGIGYEERIKIMKLLWDAIGTEFGGRHELYERNYAGGWEDIRAQTLTAAQRGGDMAAMEALVEQCMADYDASGWTGETWIGTHAD
ncbi:MAG TPA: 4-hydroxyphenylacetate 3-hydroxylase N-terminal domain-containing protein [Acetobacteraceae bacterium]|nr:4-hydroxyphenylacetate 3-hydroxylase N-terminal domain-containing protein [Acetobacteraceae bacterium]